MANRLTNDVMATLAKPFPADAIQWKPGATNKDKTRGLALAYVDLRHYIDRLNEVAGPEWSDDYHVQDGGKVVPRKKIDDGIGCSGCNRKGLVIRQGRNRLNAGRNSLLGQGSNFYRIGSRLGRRGFSGIGYPVISDGNTARGSSVPQ